MPKMLAALYNGVDTVDIKRIERLEPETSSGFVPRASAALTSTSTAS